MNAFLGAADEGERKSNQKQQLSEIDQEQISKTEEVRYVFIVTIFLLTLTIIISPILGASLRCFSRRRILRII